MEMSVQESQLDAQMEAELAVPEVVKNLATIQKISSLSPIEGADKIELAKMEGLEWQVVVQKELHKIGDFVCYIQIDSICPEKPWAEFLRDRHFRVRTIRLKKQLSQGLIVPLKDLGLIEMASYQPEGAIHLSEAHGMDVTIQTGVTKYEKPIPANLRGKIKGNFPRHLASVTDEERLQNCSRILEELIDVPVYITVKMDGTSATYIYHEPDNIQGGETHVCSRRLSLKAPAEGDAPNVYFDMERKYNILEKLKTKGSYAIQGEICGPGVQGNKAGLPEVTFLLFNVYSIKERRYLNFNEFQQFAQDLSLPVVPIIEYAVLLNGKKFDDLLAMADGPYPNNTPREGIVIRSTVERYSEYMKGRVSFKVVSNVFLEKYKE
jgi:RNA ligase (TIGR02306 family)